MPQSEPVVVVTHVDIIPGTDNVRAAEDLFQAEGAASMADSGCTLFETLAQIDRVNHFTLVCIWQDGDALDDHESSPHTRAFRTQLQPLIASPFDARPHRWLTGVACHNTH